MASSSGENNKPSEAMMQLLAPDGYYAYLKIDRTPNAEIDEDLIKKNYRKLSLKHHPGMCCDRKFGIRLFAKGLMTKFLTFSIYKSMMLQINLVVMQRRKYHQSLLFSIQIGVPYVFSGKPFAQLSIAQSS